MPKFATNKTLHGLQNNLTIDRNTLKDGRSPNLLTHHSSTIRPHFKITKLKIKNTKNKIYLVNY